jgi:ABC-type multidrug transport system ATPase subunit
MQGDLNATAFAEKIELCHALDKPLSAFSSGMMQRVKLGLALLSDVPLLLLDEPTSHLDKNAVNWYHDLLISASENKTVVIATNEIEKEVPFETQNLFIQDFRA